MTDPQVDSAPFGALRARLHEINHWWSISETEYEPDRPGSLPATGAWSFYKSDFLSALSKLAWSGRHENTRLFAITGPANTGKTTLLSQFVRLFVDEEFRELLWSLPDETEPTPSSHGPLDRRIAWAIDRYHFKSQVEKEGYSDLVREVREFGPDRVLYLPVGADPAFQLRPKRQLEEAVEYYEQSVLDGDPADTRHYVFIDDVHELTGGLDEPGWGEYITDIVEATPARKIVVTALSEESVERELYDPERDRMRLDSEVYATDAVASLKFRDYLQRRYPIFEGADTKNRVPIDYTGSLAGDYDRGRGTESNPHDPNAYRLSGTAFRQSLREAVQSGDTSDDTVGERLEEFTAKLDQIYEWLGEGAKESPRAWIQNALDEYLLLGGYVGLALDDELFEFDDEAFQAYLDGETRGGRSVAADTKEALDSTLGAIHEQAPSFASIRQSGTRDLTRLYAWAAHSLRTEPFDYDDLLGEGSTDENWILSVDRRTLREKYFRTLEQMLLLTFSDGYGQNKPRDLRVALRDVGIANTLQWRTLEDVVDEAPLRRSLKYMVAFDHVMRFSYNVNKRRDPNRGVIRYWQSGDDFVEFIPKVSGTPVPIGLETGGDTPFEKIDAVGHFLDVQNADGDSEVHDFVRYEPVVGEARTGPSGNLRKVLEWFPSSTVDAVTDSSIADLRDLWNATEEELATIEGIDRITAEDLCAAVELYDTLNEVRGVGSSKLQSLWNPPEGGHPPSGGQHWTVDDLADGDPSVIAANVGGFTERTAERVVNAAQRRQKKDEDGGEYQRRLDLVLEGDGVWRGIRRGEEGDDTEYRGWYEAYEWGSGDNTTDTRGSPDGAVHHRIHDGEAEFGIVLTGGSDVERYKSPEEQKPIYTIPLWMFLTLA